MPVSDIGHDAPRHSHSFNRRASRPWWRRLMRAMGMGMGGHHDSRRAEPFRPDVALKLAEAAHRREVELRRGLRQDITASGTAGGEKAAGE